MTEKEKMIANLLYDANYDETLIQDRIRCKDLCHAYNQLLPSQTQEQARLMRSLLAKTKTTFTIIAPFWCDYGYNIELGENFFANHNCVILDAANVSFGNNVFIGPDCGFYTAGHPIDSARRNEGLEYAHPIILGDDVWLGGGVKVMPGVTIGSNVVIGSGSIVTKDIPSHVVAAGNPCRVLRPITAADRHTDFNRPILK
ncbi:MAG: sugar O-acetyltransferase [Christensenellales bacterium]|jgi:maltose O-acetyltransferase